MIILDTAGDTIQAEASAGSSITVNCYGIETASGTDTYKRLGTAQLTGAATQDVIYTVPASTVTICSVIVIANTSGSARTIKLWDVENGGSPGDANAILGTVTIAANTTIIWNKGNIMTMPTSVGAGGGAHAILDGSTHSDSVADAVTRGSIIYGNATPKWDELAVGGAGTVLGSDGTDISWGAAGGGAFSSRCSVYRNAAQAIANNTTTIIEFDTEDYDNDNEFDSVTNHRFTVSVAGYYHVTGAVRLENLADAKKIVVTLYRNGAQNIRYDATSGIQSTLGIGISMDAYLAIGDFVDCRVWHNHGSARDLSVTYRVTSFDVHRFA